MTAESIELLESGIAHYNYTIRRYNHNSTPGNEIKVYAAQKYLNGMVNMVHALTGISIKFVHTDFTMFSEITGYITK